MVCVATHVDSHFEIASYALEVGAHVFVEKPVARTVEVAIQLFNLARLRERQLIAGYILDHDPVWAEFVDRGKRRISGSKLISFHLDQLSSDTEWAKQQKILRESSIAKNCSVHYLSVALSIIGEEVAWVYGEHFSVQPVDSRITNGIAAIIGFRDGSTANYRSAWVPR